MKKERLIFLCKFILRVIANITLFPILVYYIILYIRDCIYIKKKKKELKILEEEYKIIEEEYKIAFRERLKKEKEILGEYASILN